MNYSFGTTSAIVTWLIFLVFFGMLVVGNYRGWLVTEARRCARLDGGGLFLGFRVQFPMLITFPDGSTVSVSSIELGLLFWRIRVESQFKCKT